MKVFYVFTCRKYSQLDSVVPENKIFYAALLSINIISEEISQAEPKYTVCSALSINIISKKLVRQI